MANKTVKSIILVRNDTSTNWNTANPVLKKGEIAFISDVRQIKIGDGVSTFSQLQPISGAAIDLSAYALKTELTPKADKVTGATENHIAVLTADGNLADGGKLVTDFDASGAAAQALADAKSYTDTQMGTLGDLAVLDTVDMDALDPALKTTIDNKANKVAPAAAGNLAALDASGNLTDSGKLVTDFDAAGAATTAETNAKSYTDTEIGKLGALATKSEVAEADLASDLATKINGKADKATTLAGYGIENAYTKTEVDGLVSGAFHFKGTVATVSDLPTENNKNGDVYQVTAGNAEYAWNGTAWVELGTIVDLSGYTTTTELTTLLNGKVDKVPDKGLSTNDFTNDYKTKLDGVTAGATKVAASTTNGNIKIDDVETTVYTLPAEALLSTDTLILDGGSATV